ncbi:hypothetical protein LCI18_013423 [Fusarium solani-melongenae]|uniref:Uncharacterized protein n=1 Tax=Fusarium solani subsp. cucurbitae TaxID=2747967 RepID=A0ACD3ZMD4_FUSSC|nr:hypothetical protein LCI18_013423 [Fusarium solani-melongenae]
MGQIDQADQICLWSQEVGQAATTEVENATDESVNDTDVSEVPEETALHKLFQETTNDAEACHGLKDILPEWKNKINISLPKGGETALHIAAEKGFLETVRRLLEAGADVDAQDNEDLQPLHLACRSANESLADLLLENGANTEHADKNGRHPLYWATLHGFKSSAVIRLLGPENSLLNETDREHKWTPLVVAIKTGREELIEILLQKGASLD